MEDYRDNARTLVTGAMGVIANAVLEAGTAQKDLHVAIAQVGTRCLPASLRRTFYYTFACQSSWDRVHELFNAVARKKVDLETVRRYANQALEAIRHEAPEAPELQAWRKKHGL